MSKIAKIEKVVLKVLEEQPHTRLDDMVLIANVYDEILENKALNTYSASFDFICSYRAELGLPAFETITRVRRKIQSRRPDLIDDSTRVKRHKRIKDFKEYAKE
jgi:hypothetical protein